MKNSEWGFVGDERLYLSYSFPVLVGEPCGASPHTPAGTVSLHPFSGNSNSYHTNSFPVEQSITHTDFRRCRLYLCELDAPLAPVHGLGGGTPPTGCCASGENMKKDRRESKLSRPTFFNVFIVPVCFRFAFPSNMRKEVWENVFCVAERVQGRWPCCGVQGLHKPLLRHFLESKRKRGANPSL